MAHCKDKAKKLFLSISQNTLQNYSTNNSLSVWRIYQIFMFLLDLYNLILHRHKLEKSHYIWIGIDLFYTALIQAFIIIVRKYKGTREIIGVTSYAVVAFYHIEIYMILPSDAIIIINISLISLFAAMLFNDTIPTILKALALHTMFYSYVVYTFVKRMPADMLFIPKLSIFKYVIFSYLVGSFPIYYVLQLRASNLIKTLLLTRNIKSWAKVMNKINTAISIETKTKVIYRNDFFHNNLPQSSLCSSFFSGSKCSLGIPFIYQLDKNKYEVMKDEIYFSDIVCNIWLVHDITSISKEEEQKYLHLLIATITHELRTPLNIMMAVLNLIKESALEKEVELIEKGILAAQMQECLINDILDVAKLNNGALEISRQFVDVRKLISSIYSIFKIKIESTISFNFKIEDPFPSLISIDERRFKQILLNLLSNSSKFTQTGYIYIETSYKQGCVYCCVIDSGVGIPKGETDKIFTEFGTIKATASINSSGSGLGLNLCKKLCILMNGDIHFQSIPHIKTCFQFWFPAESKISKQCSGNLHSLKVNSVLHIDDDYLNICILNNYAAKLGLKYNSYMHGLDAIHHIKAGLCDITMAFIDLNMPIMNGYEAATQIKELIPSIILVALTGEELQTVEQKCRHSGFDIVIEKPISLDRYRKCILDITESGERNKD